MQLAAWHQWLETRGGVPGAEGGRPVIAHFGRVAEEYASLLERAAVVDLADRELLELSGADRAGFLHNFCTNDIRRLPIGGCCEAFVCDARGHVLHHVLISSGTETLQLDVEPGHAEPLRAHLDRYLIRERVEMVDRSSERAALLLAGPSSGDLLERLTGHPAPVGASQSMSATLAGADDRVDVVLTRVQLTPGHGWLVRGPRATLPAWWQTLVAAGAAPCGRLAWEIARIEQGWPRDGLDISDKNLPQELQRDRQAISFTKGCYLGQETVARIDALGHVNRLLVGLRFAGTLLPAVGCELRARGEAVGATTSVAFSPRLGSAVALGYVRRAHAAAGTALESDAGPCQVVSLPME